MKLYLVRHGDALLDYADEKRPLSDLGIQQINRLAKEIVNRNNTSIKTIFHSGFTRAKQTAQILSNALDPPNGIIPIEGLLPDDPPEIAENHLFVTGDQVMMVGHNPHITDLCAHLLNHKKYIRFKTGTTVCLERKHPGLWNLEWKLEPLSLLLR